MTDKQKNEIKKSFLVFLKALIAPTVALVSSVLTTLVTGDSIASGALVGAICGLAAQFIA